MKEKRIENIMCSIMNLLNGFANVRAELMQVARECQDNEVVFEMLEECIESNERNAVNFLRGILAAFEEKALMTAGSDN